MVNVENLIREVREEEPSVLSARENILRFFKSHPKEVFRKSQVVLQFEEYVKPNTTKVTITNLHKERLIARKTVGGITYYGSLEAIKRLDEGLRA